VVMDYELDEMCQQYEREDVIQIYLHRASDMGSLSVAEEEAIIGQADGHLKRAKGKAMLPRLTKDDVYAIFQVCSAFFCRLIRRHSYQCSLQELPRDENVTVSFHEAQKLISQFRHNRIKNYKLVYPNLTTSSSAAKQQQTQMVGTADVRGTSTMKKKVPSRVSENVAPATMFQRMKGNTNSDLIEQTTKFLSLNAYKISDFDSDAGAADLAANARLLRKTDPRAATQRLADRQRTLPGKEVVDSVTYWNSTATLKSTGLGSKVDAAASSSTWKRNSTLY
jgi:hypothetical protein